MSAVKFLRLPEVRERVGLSRSQIYKMIQEGGFPAPVKLAPQVSVWPDRDIESWQRDVMEASRNDMLGSEDSSAG